jgi:hypothetical protein
MHRRPKERASAAHAGTCSLIAALFLGMSHYMRHPLLALNMIHSVCSIYTNGYQVLNEPFIDESGVRLSQVDPSLAKEFTNHAILYEERA